MLEILNSFHCYRMVSKRLFFLKGWGELTPPPRVERGEIRETNKRKNYGSASGDIGTYKFHNDSSIFENGECEGV